jgi:hypothetical protein
VTTPISESEARFALGSIEQRRQQVMAEIDLPSWYWTLMATGWVGLGILADYGPAWSAVVGTVLFGAVHSTIAGRVLSGRRGSPQLSIRPELVAHRVPALVISFLLGMVAATVGIALLLNADGARHPAALGSGVVALLVLTGGPALMAMIRRRLVA